MEAAGEPRPVDLRDYVDFDRERPSGRRVFETAALAVDLTCLEPGQVVAARTLDGADAVYTVLGGVAWLVTDDAEVTLHPLQAVLVPAGVPHGLRNDGADPLLLQVVVSPPHPATAARTLPAASHPASPAGSATASPRRRLTHRLRREPRR
jgi:quercetin dioxygenase-like cupin family protein